MLPTRYPLYLLLLVAVKTFIVGRRFDAFSLHWVLQGIKTASMTWIEPTRMQDQKPSRNQHVSVSDSLKRRELVEEFIFWYFDSFVTPLLKVRLVSTLLSHPSEHSV
jgi:telomerase reverse transcriptase